jgi:hypothetical protein
MKPVLFLKRTLLCAALLALFNSAYAGGGSGGGGGCSPSDNPGSPTSVSAGSSYSFDNSGCDAQAACESAAISYCSSCNCTFDECEYAAMGLNCFVTSCFCGSPENTSYAQFCPTTTGTYTFGVSNISCSGGGASLQWGIQAAGTPCSTGYNMFCEAGTTANQSTSQSLTAGTCYEIFFDGNAGAACTFNFLITAPVVMPVSFLDLSATPNGGKMLIEWSTASEQNNKYFTVQRSQDGSTFKDIGQVDGKGNTNTTYHYSFTDETAPGGMLYYRIMQTDFNGKTGYSSIVVVKHAGKFQFGITKLFPSPASEFVTVFLSSDEKTDVNITVYDANVKPVSVSTRKIGLGDNIFNIDVNEFAKGMHYLVIEKGGVKTVQRFVKQ